MGVRDERTDASLIEASRTDPDTFGELFDRHYTEIRRYLHRRIGAAEGDDLTAETFALAFRARDRYDISRPDARPWLFGIAANVIRNHRRSERRQARAYARTAPEIELGPDLGIELGNCHRTANFKFVVFFRQDRFKECASVHGVCS